MRYVMLILDGAADEPLDELDEQTPLMVAMLPELHRLARRARIGATLTLPEEWEGDPEAALFTLFGYDPETEFTGCGPLEAAALEIDLEPRDLAFRLDLVSCDGDQLTLLQGDDLSADEGRELIHHLQSVLNPDRMRLYPDAGRRHVLVWQNAPLEIECFDPRQAVEKPLEEFLPVGGRAEELHQMLFDSFEILSEHEINRRRYDDGRPRANMIWPWSPGPMPRLGSFPARFGRVGAIITGTPLVEGLGRLIGLKPWGVPGATGTKDTDYAAKARATLDALETYEFVAGHIASPAQAAREGDFEAKVDALERIDERYLATLMERIGELDNYRILVVPSTLTSCAQRRALNEWTPFMLAGNRQPRQRSAILPFDERAVDEGDWRMGDPGELLEQLFRSGGL